MNILRTKTIEVLEPRAVSDFLNELAADATILFKQSDSFLGDTDDRFVRAVLDDLVQDRNVGQLRDVVADLIITNRPDLVESAAEEGGPEALCDRIVEVLRSSWSSTR